MLILVLMLTLMLVAMVVTVVSSISFGLLMTLSGLASRLLMVEVYHRVHRDYCLVMHPLHWIELCLGLKGKGRLSLGCQNDNCGTS